MTATRVQLRRGTSGDWATQNPILGQGEPGVDLTTGEVRIGNGTSTWSVLPHLPSFASVSSVSGVSVTIQPTWSLTVLTATGLVATLPDPGSFPLGKIFTVKVAFNSTTCTVAPPSGKNLDGATAAATMAAWGTKRFTSYDGTSWISL